MKENLPFLASATAFWGDHMKYALFVVFAMAWVLSCQHREASLQPASPAAASAATTNGCAVSAHERREAREHEERQRGRSQRIQVGATKSEQVRHRGDPKLDEAAEEGEEHIPAEILEQERLATTNARGETYTPEKINAELRKAIATRKQGAFVLPGVDRGPANISGRVQNVLVDAADPTQNTWLAAAYGGGLWRTRDAGETWENLTEDLGILVVPAIAQCRSQPQVLYFGTGSGYPVLKIPGAGMWKSIDGGQSWQHLPSTATTPWPLSINDIVVDPDDPDLVLACGDSPASTPSSRGLAIMRSTDGGQTWTKVFNPRQALNNWDGIYHLLPKPNDFNVLFATLDPGIILRSTNRGQTWSVVNRQDGSRIELAMAASNPEVIYGAVAGLDKPDLIVSRDGGDTWTTLVDSGSDPDFLGQDAYVMSIAVHPFDPQIVFLGGVFVWRATVTDTARSLVRMVGPYHADVHGISALFDPANPGHFKLLLNNDGGIAVSDDGATSWRQTVGMHTTQFYYADKKPGEDAYIGGMQDNGTRFLSSPSETDWRSASPGDGFDTLWHARDPNLMISTFQYGIVYLSEDGGGNFRGEHENPSAEFFTYLASVKRDPDVVYTPGLNTLDRSDDFGRTWQQQPVYGARRVVICPADVRRLYSFTPNSLVQVSHDGGLSWRRLPVPSQAILGVAVHPLDPDQYYLVSGVPGAPKILHSANGGQTYRDLSGFQQGVSANGFPDVPVYSLLVMPHDPRRIWAGTLIGIVETLDGGENWHLVEGLPYVKILRLNIVDDQVVIPTFGRGVWTVTLPELLTAPQPTTPLIPRLLAPWVDMAGNLHLTCEPKSDFDAFEFTMDGVPVARRGARTAADAIDVSLPLSDEGIHEFGLVAQRDAEPYQPWPRPGSLLLQRPRAGYETDFDAENLGDFRLQGLNYGQEAGFDRPIVATNHSYDQLSEYVLELGVPLVVPDADALLIYEDVLVAEAVLDRPAYDYLVVEATRDGLNWQTLTEPITSLSQPQWAEAYTNRAEGDASLLVRHELDLGTFFAPGELIRVRFRFDTDHGTQAWGWGITHLAVFPSKITPEPAPLDHHWVYPWVSKNDNFSSLVVVNNTGDREAVVRLTARRELGEGERTLPRVVPAHGFTILDVSELFAGLESGAGSAVTLESDSEHVHGRWVTHNLAVGRSPSQGVALRADGADLSHAGQHLVFPFLPQSEGLVSAPALVNVGDTATSLQLQFYNRDGQLIGQNNAIAKLDPLLPLGRLVTDLASSVGEDAMMVVHSSGQPLVGAAFVFNSLGETAITEAMVVAPSGGPANRLIFPWVSHNDDYDSIVAIANPSAQPAELQLEARRANGEHASLTRTIPAHGFLREHAAALFSELGAGAGFSIEVRSDNPNLYGSWITHNLRAPSGSSPSQGAAVRVPDAGGLSDDFGEAVVYGYLPRNEDLTAGAVLVNAGTEAVDVTLRYFDHVGQLVHEAMLPALEPLRPWTALTTQLPIPTGDLTLEASAPGARLTGVGFVFNRSFEPSIGNVTRIRSSTE